MSRATRQFAAAPLAQLRLLLGLWWSHLRRRPLRIGEAPRSRGVPAYLLINLLSLVYTLPLVFRSVHGDMQRDSSAWSWHVLGLIAAAYAAGVSKGTGVLQVRGGRSDEFLAALPISTLARLALGLADNHVWLLLTAMVPLAGGLALGHSALLCAIAVMLGLLCFTLCFTAGQASAAWARSLGPAATQRYAGYAATATLMLGAVLLFAPVGQLLSPPRGLARLQAWWLGDTAHALALSAAITLLMLPAYRLLVAAERRGYDRLDIQLAQPRGGKRGLSRRALEWRMSWRNGGKAQLGMVVAALVGLTFGAGTLLRTRMSERESTAALLSVGLMALYMGSLSTITQAGNAARRDLAARNFLSALPLSPFQLLDGKARVLCVLLTPWLSALGCVACVGLWQGDAGLAYRGVLSALALVALAFGAISIGFMSHGIGIAGVGSGQSSSSFSTQLLMMPLFATFAARDVFSASVAFVALGAVTWEARRAARQSVRWLDDPDDALQRETSVWRALLAATAFYAIQILTGRLLGMFEVKPVPLLVLSFASGALVLGLLTWRAWARLERPRLLPSALVYWPLGAFGGVATGALSMQLARYLTLDGEAKPAPSSPSDFVALGLVLVLFAPLVEEYFFRGWLQRAIEQDLPQGHKRWAFALGALAFALAHVGSYGVPQLLLGLVAGAVYAGGRGLGPAMLAHAAHNAVALYASH